MRGTNGLEFVELGQRVERGNVCVRAPAATALRYRGSDNPDANAIHAAPLRAAGKAFPLTERRLGDDAR